MGIIGIIMALIGALPNLLKLFEMILSLFRKADPSERKKLGDRIKKAHAAYRVHKDPVKLAKDLENIAAECKDGICKL